MLMMFSSFTSLPQLLIQVSLTFIKPFTADMLTVNVGKAQNCE